MPVRFLFSFILILLSIILLPISFALIQTQIVYQMDDAYVNESAPTSNYDSKTLFAGKETDTYESWFKFNLSDASGYYVVKSVLWTYVYSALNSKTYYLSNASDTSWTETDITWNNKPAYSNLVAQNPISSIGYFNWTITQSYSESFNEGKNFISYALYTTLPATARVILEDKENSASTGNVPYLNLTMMIPETYPIYPPSEYSTYLTNMQFQYNTTDAGNINNCSLILDGNINKTNTSVLENTTSEFLIQNIFPGIHTWQIRCYDTNRNIYEMNTDLRNLTIIAKIEWYNPSSETLLSIGTALKNSEHIFDSRQIYSNNTNNDIEINCVSGDCDIITTNWSVKSLLSESTDYIYFNCSTNSAGYFEADFSVISSQDTLPDILSVNCTIVAPDLLINSTNITFSTISPAENETVTITAGVYNIGNYDAASVIVRFYEGNYTDGIQIGTDSIVDIPAQSYVLIPNNWTAKIGSYDFSVVVDPPLFSNGLIPEIDETNNYAYKSLQTSLWTYFVGNVSGSLVLQTASNDTLLKWNVNDTTRSIIYVTDTDSSIDFSSLAAFSRDSLGNYQEDDFNELDLLLNISQFPDSINKSYTEKENPLYSRSFYVFGNFIENVPIIKSTNSTSFYTGILWDVSDDSNDNGQFDSTSKEDVLFICEVNQSQNGAYGNYDYEIRVPSRLKNYKGPDFTTVTFYTEIK